MHTTTLQEKFPNVSVIILTHNASKYIKTLLESLHGQSYLKERMEIIVVDNASTDNTLSIIQRNHPDVKLVALDKNKGFAAGNNEALKYATYDFLVFLNQDTICHRDWLKGLMLGFLENKGVGACTSNMILHNTEEFRHMNRYSSSSSLYFYNLSPFGYAHYCKDTKNRFVFPKILSACSFAIHRETVAELGYLFDKDFWMYVEDTDLSLRIHNLGLRICAAKDSVVYHLHKSDIQPNPWRLHLVVRAIMNRVYTFFKNMGGLEFFLFFPILFIGGIFKIIESRMRPYQKAVYFLPFALVSMTCMLLALFQLPKYAAKRRLVLKKRRVKEFDILKLVLNKRLNGIS